MKIKQTFLLVTLALSLSPCWAQQRQMTPEEQLQRTQAAIESAAAQARAQAAQATPGKQMGNALSLQELRAQRTQGVDIGAIASKYKDAPFEKPKMNQDLLIFISTSMPPAALAKLGREASQAKAVLILRGIKGQLGQRGALDETMRLLRPAAEAGASIQIDPEQFKLYNITAVPTFVMTQREEQCANDQCASHAHALSGDVSLEYALETWADRGGSVAKQASVYLRRIQANKTD